MAAAPAQGESEGTRTTKAAAFFREVISEFILDPHGYYEDWVESILGCVCVLCAIISLIGILKRDAWSGVEISEHELDDYIFQYFWYEIGFVAVT